MKSGSINKRVYVLWSFVFLLSGIITWRLFSLQILQGKSYTAIAKNQYKFFNSLIPERGKILTFDNYILATNKKIPCAYAVPRNVKDPEYASEFLSELLEIDKNTLYKRLSKKGDPYEPLKDFITDEQAQEIISSGISGIEISYKNKRYYPESELASQLIGFVNNQNKAQYGIEEFCNEDLQGKSGFVFGKKSALGFLISRGDFRKPKPGKDIKLTILHNVQFIAEQEIAKVVKKYNAKSGSVIVMNPEDGSIQALANYPNFDPNNYNQVKDISIFMNPVVQSVFEPGSVFKLITMAAGLDSGVISPETVYVDTGSRLIDGFEVHNWSKKAYGKQTMTQILEKSLNTGAIFVEEKLGKQKFLQYVKNFGFGVLTGISLVGERSGSIQNLMVNSDINYATASYGQGIAVTPIQIITSVSAIANKGLLVQPHILADKKSVVVRRVISAHAAEQLKNMMISVLEKSDKAAGVNGYKIAVKTGTAQIPGESGYTEQYTHTFVGFAPADNPKFVILLKLDKPVGVRFSGISLVNTFHNLAKFLLHYYQIAPSQ